MEGRRESLKSWDCEHLLAVSRDGPVYCDLRGGVSVDECEKSWEERAGRRINERIGKEEGADCLEELIEIDEWW